MSAERNSSFAFTLCLSVEFEFVKKLKKKDENSGFWNVSVSVLTQHTTDVYVCSLSYQPIYNRTVGIHICFCFLHGMCVLQSVMSC